MPGVYGRVTKITNAKGRAGYLKDEKRQEEIVLQKEEMRYSWEEHSAYEQDHRKTNKDNNEALEVHLALPNELADEPERLEVICDEISQRIVGENKDYEYAVHWNHNRTNLHVHILFSERENNLKLNPKIYKKDIWHDRDTHKLAKAGAENAVLVHHKGDVQKDKNGDIKYDNDIFKPKDIRFKTREWVHGKNVIIQEVLKEHGYDLDIITRNTPFLAQKKLYKGASQDYLEKAEAWNNSVKEYNAGVKAHIIHEPMTKPLYMQIKKELEQNVKDANADTRKITDRAIELVQEMASWVKGQVVNLKANLMTRIKSEELVKNWTKIKAGFDDLFSENEQLKQENASDFKKLKVSYSAEKNIQQVIDSKQEVIADMEYDFGNEEDDFLDSVNKPIHELEEQLNFKPGGIKAFAAEYKAEKVAEDIGKAFPKAPKRSKDRGFEI